MRGRIKKIEDYYMVPFGAESATIYRLISGVVYVYHIVDTQTEYTKLFY